MKRQLLSRVATITALAGVLALAACSGSDNGSGGDESGKASVVLTVGGKPTADKAEQVAQWNRLVEQFEAANPNITIKAEETKFDVKTFNALVAGGQLPTVFNVPFTEMRGLIARQQVADLTDYVPKSTIISSINPLANKIVTADNHIYGVPWGAYTMGIVYNRDLFTKAGLDPDKPPATWDEVRAAAKAIQTKTGVQGFASMTTNNTGGWALTTMSYGFGSSIVSEDGKTAQLENPATVAALEFLHTLRWDDNAMGSNFLLNQDDAGNLFGGGKAGMYVTGADAYSGMVTNKGMKPGTFGVGPLPQQNGIGTLGGGTVAIVKPTAKPAEIDAAIKWLEFQRFGKYLSKDAAESDAKATAADKLPVGKPEFPVVDNKTYEQYLSWIAPYINVPRKNFTAYLSSVNTLPLVPEPAVKAQELYGLLDPVVQAVLTRKDADIKDLLGKADKAAQTILDAD